VFWVFLGWALMIWSIDDMGTDGKGIEGCIDDMGYSRARHSDDGSLWKNREMAIGGFRQQVLGKDTGCGLV
jgi:hypothetical protein